eukprot:c26528_g1_i1 orf=121-354(+)
MDQEWFAIVAIFRHKIATCTRTHILTPMHKRPHTHIYMFSPTCTSSDTHILNPHAQIPIFTHMHKFPSLPTCTNSHL